ncbi:TPA: hypothetical protein ACGSHJ_000409 [Escherichia coli]
MSIIILAAISTTQENK